MKITICYDNTVLDERLTPDWGFSCLVEEQGRRILFDTGGNGEILLANLELLSLDPKSFTDIFISHPDFDHIGGLCHVLNLNPQAILHLPENFRGVKYTNPIHHYIKPSLIHGKVCTTGELEHGEQSLAVVTESGWVLVIGCAHPGVGRIMAALGTVDASLPFHALVGGLHGFDEFSLLERFTRVCPTHCTRHIETIKRRYPEKYLPGGAGAVLEF